MIFIGIDTGVHTGFALWQSDTQSLADVATYSITQAMERVRAITDIVGYENVRIYIEDARKRTWFENAGREKLQGAGSVKRDCSIWEDWCKEQGIECVMVPPKHNRTKLSASQFRVLTKWTGRTSEHARDAALLVFGR